MAVLKRKRKCPARGKRRKRAGLKHQQIGQPGARYPPQKGRLSGGDWRTDVKFKVPLPDGSETEYTYQEITKHVVRAERVMRRANVGAYGQEELVDPEEVEEAEYVLAVLAPLREAIMDKYAGPSYHYPQAEHAESKFAQRPHKVTEFKQLPDRPLRAPKKTLKEVIEMPDEEFKEHQRRAALQAALDEPGPDPHSEEAVVERLQKEIARREAVAPPAPMQLGEGLAGGAANPAVSAFEDLARLDEADLNRARTLASALARDEDRALVPATAALEWNTPVSRMEQAALATAARRGRLGLAASSARDAEYYPMRDWARAEMRRRELLNAGPLSKRQTARARQEALAQLRAARRKPFQRSDYSLVNPAFAVTAEEKKNLDAFEAWNHLSRRDREAMRNEFLRKGFRDPTPERVRALFLATHGFPHMMPEQLPQRGARARAAPAHFNARGPVFAPPGPHVEEVDDIDAGQALAALLPLPDIQPQAEPNEEVLEYNAENLQAMLQAAQAEYEAARDQIIFHNPDESKEEADAREANNEPLFARMQVLHNEITGIQEAIDRLAADRVAAPGLGLGFHSGGSRASFERLRAQIRREYVRKGCSPAEADRIARATAGKVARAKLRGRGFELSLARTKHARLQRLESKRQLLGGADSAGQGANSNSGYQSTINDSSPEQGVWYDPHPATGPLRTGCAPYPKTNGGFGAETRADIADQSWQFPKGRGAVKEALQNTPYRALVGRPWGFGANLGGGALMHIQQARALGAGLGDYGLSARDDATRHFGNRTDHWRAGAYWGQRNRGLYPWTPRDTPYSYNGLQLSSTSLSPDGAGGSFWSSLGSLASKLSKNESVQNIAKFAAPRIANAVADRASEFVRGATGGDFFGETAEQHRRKHGFGFPIMGDYAGTRLPNALIGPARNARLISPCTPGYTGAHDLGLLHGGVRDRSGYAKTKIGVMPVTHAAM